MNCKFCDIIKNKTKAFKVWENHDFILLLDINPVNPGHLLLIPKKHVNNAFSLQEPLYSRMFKMTKKIAIKLQKITKARRIGLAIEGFGVPHVHIHLVPVNKSGELSPQRAERAPQKDLKKMQDKFIQYFKKLK